MKKVRLAIIGSGFIGKGIARHLGEEFATSLVGARNVIAVRTWAEDPGLSDQYVLVFAHGRNVNVRCFDRQFDEILRSRLEPLDRVAEMFPTAPAVLVSSTAALSPCHSRRARSLPAMQRIFEERFVSLFGERASILRVGTLVGPGSQFSEGLAALRKTILLKRLRSAGAPKLLWADLPLVAEAVTRAQKLQVKQGRELRPEEFNELVRMEPDRGTTNVRNVASQHWKRWLAPEFRCLVPFNSFSEFDNTAAPGGGKNGDTWFAFDADRPLAFFAGIWIPQWTSIRKIKEGVVSTDLYGFLTTEPNDVVGSIHMKAMPVILTTPDEVETWLTAPWEEASKLQRPLPHGVLKIVAVGAKKDGRPEFLPEGETLL